MASPTPNKGYTYPAHGGAVGAWDTPLNTNFDFIDLNVGGYYPVTIFSSVAGATYNSSGAIISSTVAVVTFPSSLAENLYYNLTGTITRDIALTYPAAGGIYVIGNNSSGAFNVTALPAGGASVTITQGGQTPIVTVSSAAFLASNAFGDITVNSIVVSSNARFTNPSARFEPPSGTAAQRPGTPSAGAYRFDTDIKTPETFDGNQWRAVPVSNAIAAGYRNLKITNTTPASPDTQVALTADALTMESTAGTAYRLTSISLTINSSVNGANGLDAGGLANNTWYAIYSIFSSSSNTTAGLLSAQFSSSSVTMPAGYDAQARFGAIRTTGSAHFNRTLQYGNHAQYVVTSGSTTAALPNIANGVAGTYSITAPVYAAASIANVVPPTASDIDVVMTGHWNNTGSAHVFVAPNNSYSGDSTTNPPPAGTTGGATNSPLTVRLTIESTNIYWTSDNNGGGISCLGWTDNLT